MCLNAIRALQEPVLQSASAGWLNRILRFFQSIQRLVFSNTIPASTGSLDVA